MVRSHKIRLNPTRKQEQYFWQAAGVARFASNWALSRWKDYRAASQSVSMNTLKAEFNAIKRERFPWVLEVTKCAVEQEFANLGRTLTNFFRMAKQGALPKLKRLRNDSEPAGFPRYKNRKRATPSFYLANDKFRVEGLEDLNVRGMVQNRKLARALSDASFSTFKTYLAYKTPGWLGMVIEVRRFFASSKLCNQCGYKNPDLTLAEREWYCPVCRLWVDRDRNAVPNIHDEAYHLIMASR